MVDMEAGIFISEMDMYKDKSIMLRVHSVKGMGHVPNIFMSFDKYLFSEVINILIWIGLFKQSEIQLLQKYLKPI